MDRRRLSFEDELLHLNDDYPHGCLFSENVKNAQTLRLPFSLIEKSVPKPHSTLRLELVDGIVHTLAFEIDFLPSSALSIDPVFSRVLWCDERILPSEVWSLFAQSLIHFRSRSSKGSVVQLVLDLIEPFLVHLQSPHLLLEWMRPFDTNNQKK